MATFTEVISSFPPDLQGPVLQLWNVIKDELGVKREDFTELKSIVQELAQAQRRTEERVEELAQAQRQTDRSVQRLSETIEFKIGGLGRRGGVGSEASFRRGLREILSDTGYEVVAYIKKDDAGVVFGHPAVIEIDVLVRGDRTVGVEIKSSVGRDDVYVFKRKAEFYERMSGHRIDLLLMITPFIDDEARRVATEFGMVVCDSLSMLEGDGLKGL